MAEICERHNVLKRKCDICFLEEDLGRYRRGLEEIAQVDEKTGEPVLNQKEMIELANFVLDFDNEY